jgi:hypothetical protein
MKNAVFWDVTPFGSCNNRRFGVSVAFTTMEIISELGTTLAITNAVPSSLNLFVLMMEVIRSSETSVLTRASRYHIEEDGIFCEFHNC